MRVLLLQYVFFLVLVSLLLFFLKCLKVYFVLVWLLSLFRNPRWLRIMEGGGDRVVPLLSHQDAIVRKQSVSVRLREQIIVNSICVVDIWEIEHIFVHLTRIMLTSYMTIRTIFFLSVRRSVLVESTDILPWCLNVRKREVVVSPFVWLLVRKVWTFPVVFSILIFYIGGPLHSEPVSWLLSSQRLCYRFNIRSVQ